MCGVMGMEQKLVCERMYGTLKSIALCVIRLIWFVRCPVQMTTVLISVGFEEDDGLYTHTQNGARRMVTCVCSSCMVVLLTHTSLVSLWPWVGNDFRPTLVF